MKVLDSSSLRDTMQEREQHYKELRKQFTQLRNTFQGIVDLDDFEGKGAKAIKGFYQGQIEVVEAWQRLIDRQIAFFKGVSGKLDDKDLGGDTRIDSAFLEEDLAQKERQADEMITEQRRSLEHIFWDIDDLVSLEPYSRSKFDDLMMDANKMRTKTIEAVEETDKLLKDEYMSSEGEESYVIQLFGALISATNQGSIISPIHFDADAYHSSDVYKQMEEAEASTLSYLTYKKEEQEARDLENRPAVEKVWDGIKSFVGEFTGYYDYKRAVDGVDPVTGEKMSAVQRAASAGWAIAGLLPVVGWAGRAVKGGKGIYAAAKGISSAEQAMSAYKNVQAFTALEKTEMGIYGLLSANGLSEYVTGKDMLGNELTDQQRQASLAQSVFAELPFVPGMAKEANRLGQQAVQSTERISNQGADVIRVLIDDLGQKINTSPNTAFAGGVGNMESYLKAESRADVDKVSGEKSEYLNMLSGRGSGVVDKATVKKNPFGNYSTAIDDKVKVIEKVDLPDWISESFTDGNYRTVVTEENIKFYRTYGGGAKAGGAFVTTSPAGNRINAKISTALVPDWKNSRQYEAVIEVPKGQILNIGRVEKQYTKTGALLEGDGDQILLPQGWPSEWIIETREVPSR